MYNLEGQFQVWVCFGLAIGYWLLISGEAMSAVFRRISGATLVGLGDFGMSALADTYPHYKSHSYDVLLHL